MKIKTTVTERFYFEEHASKMKVTKLNRVHSMCKHANQLKVRKLRASDPRTGHQPYMVNNTQSEIKQVTASIRSRYKAVIASKGCIQDGMVS